MNVARGVMGLSLSALSLGALAQSGFNSGSNGSYGPVYVPRNVLTVASPLPPAGGPLAAEIAAFALRESGGFLAAGANRLLRHYSQNATGCTSTGGFPSGTFTNSVALIQWGDCAVNEKITNAAAAGAIAALIFSNTEKFPIQLTEISTIPSALLDRTQGEALRNFVVSNGDTQTLINIASGEDAGLQVPPDGIFNATTVYVDFGQDLGFVCNQRNTPVYLLAAREIIIRGLITNSAASTVGGRPTPGANPFVAPGGCGGFAGGAGGISGLSAPGDGLGPGAGRGGESGIVGSASFGAPSSGTSPLNGVVYGGNLLVPIVGGSGGGGRGVCQGGGGGGALLMAANDEIVIFDGSFQGYGEVRANGAQSTSTSCSGGGAGAGSGGAIRLIAPRVSGGGLIRVQGGSGAPTAGGVGGTGRIRVDTVDRTGFQIDMGAGPRTIGSFMQVFPPNVPELHIVNVAGTAIPVGSGPVNVLLPIGSPATQGITLRGVGFTGNVPVRVVLTPDSGPSVTVDGTLAMGGQNSADVTLQAEVPANVTMNVSAWVRNQ
jgi:hypothetical protein